MLLVEISSHWRKLVRQCYGRILDTRQPWLNIKLFVKDKDFQKVFIVIKFDTTTKMIVTQGRNCLPKTGWASSNAARRHCPASPSILPKSGWAKAHPATRHLRPCHHNQSLGLLVSFLHKIAQRCNGNSDILLAVQTIAVQLCNLDYSAVL